MQQRPRPRRPRPSNTSNSSDDEPASRKNPPSIDHTALPDPAEYASLRCRPRHNPRRRGFSTCIDLLLKCAAFGVVILWGMLVWEIFIPEQKQRVYVCTLGVTLIPVFLAFITAVKPNKPIHQRLTPVVVVGTIVAGRFPAWFNASVAAVLLFLYAWVTRPESASVVDTHHKKEDDVKSDDDKKDAEDTTDEETKKLLSTTTATSKPKQQQSALGTMSRQDQLNYTKAAMCGFLMGAVFFTENFFIWVVSATYEASWNPQTAPDPLQDNGQRVMKALFDSLDLTKREVVSMRRVWNTQFALVVAVGVILGTMDYHPTRQLWSLSSRTLLTLSCARMLRVVAFLLTVLPSQNKRCYMQHFPYPPPTDWGEWIFEGFKPASHGGCNDLIVSGHATVTSTMAAVSISMAEDSLFSFAVCWLLAMDYAVEIYEGFHYSVDMWMGAILCGLLWRVWKPVEDNNMERNKVTLQDIVKRLQNDRLTFRDIVEYGGPATISFLQVTIIPEVMANFVMAGFLAACVAQIVVQGFQQYTKYLFFCVIYMSVGIYL
ncbi:expressed unknown protein [Seminavis robusta]|uniref:Sphingomyelin synthase-like domain-containing protein n=1 Tax=Seminavis robusta TaxID=568900 RepID=A0A9N8DDB2_9STRA|nr:expressed unknown protein [Seminavis robusta]|eukprot:Sro89_g047120.1 n/a (545) ;mRNA; r:109711-111345